MTANGTIKVTINGEARELPPETSVDALLAHLGLTTDLVAVELNRELVRKREFASRLLGEGDHVEVVEFVGGG
jgi:sulfur carrier protein